ncbi:MAG TPA: NAD(P)-dependent oxidoreductase, partial [Rhodospirillaceae bacterium]|nr:NAD(P)-dependent oxidoreductase [Rhodospirillaceae bacterium]
GLLGHALVPYLAGEGHEVDALFHTHRAFSGMPAVHEVSCDLMDGEASAKMLDEAAPDILVHAAGLTSVDRCEESPDLAALMNVTIPERLAKWCLIHGKTYVFISSDHVTGGGKPLFTEDDPAEPVNVYARTKAEAELTVLNVNPSSIILRTNFFGKGPKWRKSLSDWLWDKAASRDEIPAFADSFFSPLSSRYLAQVITDMALSKEKGIFHAGGSERLSKYDFALKFMDFFGFDKSLVRKSSMSEVGLSAPRPVDMSMSVEKIERILGRSMPDILESLESVREDYTAHG